MNKTLHSPKISSHSKTCRSRWTERPAELIHRLAWSRPAQYIHHSALWCDDALPCVASPIFREGRTLTSLTPLLGTCTLNLPAKLPRSSPAKRSRTWRAEPAAQCHDVEGHNPDSMEQISAQHNSARRHRAQFHSIERIHREQTRSLRISTSSTGRLLRGFRTLNRAAANPLVDSWAVVNVRLTGGPNEPVLASATATPPSESGFIKMNEFDWNLLKPGWPQHVGVGWVLDGCRCSARNLDAPHLDWFDWPEPTQVPCLTHLSWLIAIT